MMVLNGMALELDTLHGRMMVNMLAGIAQFERGLISEWGEIRSGRGQGARYETRSTTRSMPESG
ncbi:MAG: hypothetical protein OXC57_10180 [Rhodobacteraceae bacterium]|nr:hypothetical protein [Paracoccaceae bacterium]